MLKANFNTGAVVPASTNMPLTTIKNTNDRVVVDKTDNSVKFLRIGDIYTVNAVLVATSSAATPVTAQLYENGVAVPGAISTAVPAAVGDAMTFVLQDAFRVIPGTFGELADVSIQCSENVTPTGGNVIVKYER